MSTDPSATSVIFPHQRELLEQYGFPAGDTGKKVRIDNLAGWMATEYFIDETCQLQADLTSIEARVVSLGVHAGGVEVPGPRPPKKPPGRNGRKRKGHAYKGSAAAKRKTRR